MDKKQRIRELTELLNKASRAYYSEDKEIISNFEYDALYDELVKLEAETQYILADSPTQNVGYEVSKELIKEPHEHRMLSLDKTKDVDTLKDFLGDKKGILSWKLDGLTIVLTYNDGKLEKAVTRGNGEIGEIVTANAKTFKNLPLNIAYKNKLIVRGEAVIKYSDFKKLNDEIPEESAKYKNPRNLCSGAVRQLNPAITAERNVFFYAFSLEDAEIDFKNSNENKLKWLLEEGFETVPFKVVNNDNIQDEILNFEKEIQTFYIPSDGLVLLLDDIEYGKSLGTTAKFPKNAMAFKWQDETADTVLEKIEWSPSRTGLINPIAVFKPVELEGTTVSRASLHNLSIIEDLNLGVGDTITVYKANMIIPQVAGNKSRSGNITYPEHCPSCGADTIVKCDNGVKTLHCPNDLCPAKKIKKFTNFVSRNAMNIDGISEETLEKFIGRGFITDFTDIYHLERYKDEIINMPGFGARSYENIISSVNSSRETTAQRFINSLGILNVGSSNAKVICSHYNDDIEMIINSKAEDLIGIDGIGDVIAQSVEEYFNDETNKTIVKGLLEELDFNKENDDSSNVFDGLTFVITGSLNDYENRDALKKEIESNGGKVSSSVSGKTSYLINNDINSSSGKNKDAKKYGIPVISEEDYQKLRNRLLESR